MYITQRLRVAFDPLDLGKWWWYLRATSNLYISSALQRTQMWALSSVTPKTHAVL